MPDSRPTGVRTDSRLTARPIARAGRHAIPNLTAVPAT